MTELHDEIIDAFALVGLLLVFVFAYFTTVWARAEEILEEPTPTVGADKRRLRGRHQSHARLVVGLAIVVVAVFALMLPLAVRVLDHWTWSPFDTVQAGLIVLEAFLLAMLLVSWLIWKRLKRRQRDLTN